MKLSEKAVLCDRKAHAEFGEKHPTVALYFVPERKNINPKFAKFVASSYTTSQSRYVMTIELDENDYELNAEGFKQFKKDYQTNEVWEGVNLFSFPVSELSEGKFNGFYASDKNRVSYSRYIASFDTDEKAMFQREKNRFRRQLANNKIHGVNDANTEEAKTESEKGEED